MYFPRHIKITREIEMESIVSLSIRPLENSYFYFLDIYCSCRTWWISWNDTWSKFVGYGASHAENCQVL